MAEVDRTKQTQTTEAARVARRPSSPAVQQHPLLGLQRSAGNGAVVAMLDSTSRTRGDEEERESESAEGGGPETEAATENAAAGESEGGETEESESTEGGESEEEQEIVVTGSLSTSEMGESETEEWGPPPGVVADRRDPSSKHAARKAGTPGQRPAARTTRPAPSGPQRYRLDIDFGVNTAIEQAPLSSLDRNDGITAHPNVKVQISGGASVGAFGAMTPTHSFSNLAFKAKTGFFSGAYVQLKFDVNVLCSWGVADGGRTDIASGTSGAITADNYQQVMADLTPTKVEKSWVAPRTRFFSSAIVSRHEQYHATDERDWVTGQGASFLSSYLAGKSVVLDETERADPTAIGAKIAPIMQDARVALANASDAYYSGPPGTTYYSKPGEERAFGDGKQPYLSLVAAVKARGEALKAAAAAKAVATPATPTPPTAPTT